MNKLRGEHDITKDVAELSGLMNTNPGELMQLLHIDERTLNEMAMLAKAPDNATWENYFDNEDVTLEQDLVQVTFYLKKMQRDKLLKKLATVNKDKETALMKVVNAYG